MKAGLANAGLGEQEIRDLAASYAAPIVPFSNLFADLIRTQASASLDISDGLAIDLERLCAASGVGAVINLSDIPLDYAVRRLVDTGAWRCRK